MVKIRLKRQGRKHRPFYRIVVTDIRNRRDGAPLSELGYYNPISKELKLDKQAALDWISKGAQPSDTAKKLIEKADEGGNLIRLESAKRDKLSKKAAEKAKSAAAE
jgi:small subunit ribosomal protein S16